MTMFVEGSYDLSCGHVEGSHDLPCVWRGHMTSHVCGGVT